MMENVLLTIGAVMTMLGVKMIYDARPIVKMYFSFGQENEAVLGIKILGFIISIFGGFLIYFYM